MAFSREEIFRCLKKTIDGGRPIIIAGAGNGISAKFEDSGLNFDLEVEMIEKAHELDLFTVAADGI